MNTRSSHSNGSMRVVAILAIVLGWSSAQAADFNLTSKNSDLNLYSTVLQGNYLELRKGELHELDYNGKVVRSMSLKKGFWSDAEQHSGQNLYSVNFTATDTKKTAPGAWPAIFKMTATFGTKRRLEIQNGTACTGCTSGSGACQQPAARSCKPISGPGMCPRRHLLCSTEVVTEKDLLTFSVALSNWVFQDASNTLQLQLTLKPKKDKKVFPVAKDQWSEVNLEETGLLTLPTHAMIVDVWQNTQEVSADTTVDFDEKKVLIEFNIASYADGSAYYNFDPDLIL